MALWNTDSSPDFFPCPYLERKVGLTFHLHTEWNHEFNPVTTTDETAIVSVKLCQQQLFIYRTLFANLIGSTKKLANKIIYTYNVST